MNYLKETRRQNIRKAMFTAVADYGYSAMLFLQDMSE
jgi:hypothetical protein